MEKEMKDVPMDKKKNLGKLPEEVRNKMGFKKAGGKVKMMKEGGSTSKRKKDKSPKVFLGDPNRDGTIKKKAGGKVKMMKEGGMAEKVHDTTMRYMKDIDRADYSKSVKNFKKDYGSVSKKIRESMKTGKSGKKAGGKVKKMMGGGMAMKYKHGGKVGKKCPRDGIAMKGKTRA